MSIKQEVWPIPNTKYIVDKVHMLLLLDQHGGQCGVGKDKHVSVRKL